MRTRRSHNKSRGGCQRCKQRKIKCDEARPACSSCARRGLGCSYDTGHGHRSPSKKPDDRLTDSSRQYSLADMRLVHHYTSQAWTTCSSESIVDQRLWQQRIPVLAMNHDCLLYAMLCFTSLHMDSKMIGDAGEFLCLAHDYRQRSLEALSLALRQQDGANGEAMFWASTFIGLITLALHHVPADVPSSPLQLMLEVSALWRGSATIKNSHKALDAMSLRSLRDGHHQSSSDSIVTTSCERTNDLTHLLDLLRGCIQSSQILAASHNTNIYLDSLDQLSSAINEPHTKAINTSTIGWIACVDKEVVNQMRAKEPIACLIGMIYGFGLHRLRNVWYIQNLGMELIQELTVAIPLSTKQWTTIANKVRDMVCLEIG